MLRKIFTRIFLILVIFTSMFKAQTLQAGISISGNSLIVSAMPNSDISANMSGLNVTIIWSNTYGSSILGAISSSYGAIVQQGSVGSSGANFYADFGFAGSVYAINWANGSTNELFRIAINQTGSGTGTFALTNSAGGGWYFEVGGSDYTNYSTPFYASSVSNAPLPVELTSFSANTISNKIELDWKTSTEINNYGFEIERYAQSAERQAWTKIGFVKGSGNSNSPKSYSFVDMNPTGGSDFQYRLKQIDNNGSYKYSEVVEAKILPSKYELYQNYPNPFNPSTTIKYQIPNSSHVTLKVYDGIGREVASLVNENKEAGSYSVQLSAVSHNLASGIYYYRMQAGSYVETKKLLLLK